MADQRLSPELFWGGTMEPAICGNTRNARLSLRAYTVNRRSQAKEILKTATIDYKPVEPTHEFATMY
jgi:hypothetical protein